MIEILNKRIEKYEVTCDHCHAKLSFSKGDINSDYCAQYNFEYIKCPRCKERIILKVNKMITSDMKRIQ